MTATQVTVTLQETHCRLILNTLANGLTPTLIDALNALSFNAQGLGQIQLDAYALEELIGSLRHALEQNTHPRFQSRASRLLRCLQGYHGQFSV